MLLKESRQISSNIGFHGALLMVLLLSASLLLSSSGSTGSTAFGQNSGILDFKRGDPAPVIRLNTLDGKEFDTSKLAPGTTRIVLFGDVNMVKTQTVCRRLITILEDKDVVGDNKVVQILVLSGKTIIEEAQSKIAETPKMWPDIILHDTERMVFENYDVTVLPSTVIIDGDGKVVHAIAGVMPMYYDVLVSAVMLSTGKIDADQFEKRLNPSAKNKAVSHDQAKADRAVKLAAQLIKHNIIDGAVDQYLKAIKLIPEHIDAHMGLAQLYMTQKNYDAAQAIYEKVLDIQPSLIDPKLGLASISILTAEEEDLDEVIEYLKQIISKDKNVAKAHYLLGCIYEKRNETDLAIAAYKLAAEILMEQ